MNLYTCVKIQKTIHSKTKRKKKGVNFTVCEWKNEILGKKKKTKHPLTKVACRPAGQLPGPGEGACLQHCGFQNGLGLCLQARVTRWGTP